MRHQHSSVRGVRRPPLAAADVPGIANHQLEVVVAVNARTEVGVIPLKFSFCDDGILFFAARLRIMQKIQ